MDALSRAACGVCKKEFDGSEGLVRSKSCGHLYHGACFQSGDHVKKIGEVVQKMICPSCDHVIAEQKNGEPIKWTEVVEVIPKNAPSADGAATISKGEMKGLKYIAWGSLVLVSMIVACVAYPSFIALGFGAAISIPIGYLVARNIERYSSAA